MAKGSVRKKGKKWYYRFYVEDASGNRVQKEYPGTESKAETEAMLRKAMEDYESKRFVAKAENVTLGAMLDEWVDMELKTGPFSNGTVEHYQFVVDRIKQHPISRRKLKTVTPDHLQAFFDLLAFGGICEAFVSKGYMPGSLHSFSSVLNHSFRFAVFPKQYITFNPMQYVVLRKKQNQENLFLNKDVNGSDMRTLSPEMYNALLDYLKERNPSAVLPVQISYYTGLRIGEVCGLSWEDIHLDEQYLTVRRSSRYRPKRRKTEISTTKSKKVRIVDFCDTLKSILKKAKREQAKQRLKYGVLYHRNYYREVVEKNRVHYELEHFDGSTEIPEGYTEIPLVCIRPDGSFESYDALSTACKMAGERVPGLEGFHFHLLRHTYTTNLLAQGAHPKEVQELLGHADVSTTMNVYAHASREAKRQSAKLLDNLAVGM